MTTYHQEKVQTAIAKIAECMARDPKRAERLLGDVKQWSAEAEREAYARGKADAAPQASAEASSLPEVRCAKCEMKVLSKCSSDCPVPDGYALVPVKPSEEMMRAMESCSDDWPRTTWLKAWAAALSAAPAAVASAKGAGDVALPLLPKPQNGGLHHTQKDIKDYARAAILADRQQRGGDVDERVAFEASERNRPGYGEDTLTVYTQDAGEYALPLTQARWAGWQARAALAAKPAASAEPSDEEIDTLADDYFGPIDDVEPDDWRAFARALLSRYGRPAGDAQPAARASSESDPIGFLCPVPGSAAGPVFVPLDRTARNADDLYGWRPVYAAPVAAGEAQHYEAALRQIGDYAHDHSTGPAVPDALWAVRSLAYDALSDAPVAAQKADDARDAERYRLLRRGQNWSVIDGIGDTLRADALDAAIDAAISAQQRQEGQP